MIGRSRSILGWIGRWAVGVSLSRSGYGLYLVTTPPCGVCRCAECSPVFPHCLPETCYGLWVNGLTAFWGGRRPARADLHPAPALTFRRVCWPAADCGSGQLGWEVWPTRGRTDSLTAAVASTRGATTRIRLRIQLARRLDIERWCLGAAGELRQRSSQAIEVLRMG